MGRGFFFLWNYLYCGDCLDGCGEADMVVSKTAA